MEAPNTRVLDNTENLSLCDYLVSIGFDVNRFSIPLEFWFELNSKSDEEWFILNDELINIMGFKPSISNPSTGRSHLLRFIRNHFISGTDFLTTLQKVEKFSKGGAQHKNEIQMKKRPFKKMLLTVNTSTSSLIHDYLLDLEEGCTKYVLYQEQCKTKAILEENSRLKRSRIEADLETDLSCFPEISIQSYDRMSVLYLVYLRQYNALKFGISNNIVDRIQQHCRTLGDKQGDVKLVYLVRTEHGCVIESSLKQCVIMNGWKKDDVVVNGSLQLEIIDLNKTTIQNIIRIVTLFIDDHDKLTKEREDVIINRSIDMEKFRIESELESKRLDLEIKRVDLESKKLDITKISMEYNNQNKKQSTISNYYCKK